MLFPSNSVLFLHSFLFRSSGKIQSDFSARWREKLPHLLPDLLAQETRTPRYSEESPTAWLLFKLKFIPNIEIYIYNITILWLKNQTTAIFHHRHAAGVIKSLWLPLLLAGRYNCGPHGWWRRAACNWCKYCLYEGDPCKEVLRYKLFHIKHWKTTHL